MLWCPICRKLEGFTTGSQMLKHFRALINDGVPVDLPLKCNLCQASYQSPKSFTQHITTYHEVPNPSDTQVIPPNNCENCSSNDNIFSQPAYIDTAMDVDSDHSESERDPADFYDDKVSEILLQAFSNSSIPHEFIADMIKSFEEYVDVWEHVKQITACSSKNHGLIIINTNLFESNDCELHQSIAALTRVNTPFKAKNSLIRNPLYVAPEMIPLSYRWEAHLQNGNTVSNKLISEQFSYISIVKTIRSLFSDKEFATVILNEAIDRSPFYPRGRYENFTDGSCFRNHTLFCDPSKTALRIQTFYDGM